MGEVREMKRQLRRDFVQKSGSAEDSERNRQVSLSALLFTLSLRLFLPDEGMLRFVANSFELEKSWTL